MRERITAGILCALLFAMAFVAVAGTSNAQSVWTVDDDGPADFSSISAALASPLVLDGDTIYVAPGHYGGLFVVDKSVSLIGADKYTTLIDGWTWGPVVTVTADDVIFTGFTVYNTEYISWGGMGQEQRLNSMTAMKMVNADNAHVYDNVFTDFRSWGLRMVDSDYCVIEGNHFALVNPPYYSHTNHECLLVDEESDYNTVQYNTFDYGWTGITVRGSHNDVLYNDLGSMEIGYWYDYLPTQNEIVGNTMSNGLFIFTSTENFFRDNTMDSFGFWGDTALEYRQDIDTTNTVRGRPIYYYRNANNVNVPGDAAIVVAVDSTGIKVNGIDFRGIPCSHTVIFANTDDSEVRNNQADNAHRSIYLLDDSDGNLIKGNYFDDVTHSIWLVDSDENIIEDNTGNVYSWHAYRSVYLYQSDNNMIRGNTFYWGQGIIIEASDGNQILDNELFATSIHISHDYVPGGYVGSNDNLVEGNTIHGNWYHPDREMWIRSGTIGVSRSEGNIVRGNHLIDCWTGMYLWGKNLNLFEGNDFTDCDRGIYLESPTYDSWEPPTDDRAIIRDNVFTDCEQGIYGRYAWPVPTQVEGGQSAGFEQEIGEGGEIVKPIPGPFPIPGPGPGPSYPQPHPNAPEWRLDIAFNDFDGCDQAIYIGWAKDVNIYGNTIVDSSVGDQSGVGIHLPGCLGLSVWGNTVEDSDLGIYLEGSYECDVYGNTLEDDLAGMFVQHTYDTQYEGNVIYANTIRDNEYGLVIDGSLNVVYHNDFIDNTDQAFQSDYNTWNNADDEGNYWSDYEGEDLNGDGIGDTLVPHLGLDFYPLTEPHYGTPIDALEDMVEGLGLPHGKENSLLTKLRNAQKSIENGNYNAAINQLEAFINEVEAMRGKDITDEEADELIAMANAVIEWILTL